MGIISVAMDLRYCLLNYHPGYNNFGYVFIKLDRELQDY